ncbi:MAG: hypothetical protein A2147_06005 [Chloroflexi bacterium RBG_16_57_8]|nr:MAG: hypothetical protein A2147_06005 [Chloroflexi bacterium RBG_16_57_8]
MLGERGAISGLEVDFKNKAGRVRKGILSMEPIRIQGEPCVIGTLVDITERYQSEELLRDLAMRSPIGIYVVQKGKFVYTNPRFQEDTGYQEDELLGMPSLSLVTPEDRKAVRENAIQMLKGNRIAPYEYRVIAKNGLVRNSLETVASIWYRGERATIGSYQDVTESKRTQEQLILSDRLASIGEMVSGIAHELNNPLTGIIGFSQLLMEKDLSSDVREKLAIISGEAERAVRIVRGLLTFARRRPAAKHPSNIEEIIEDVLRLRAYEQRVNNIQVVRRFAAGVPEVMVDRFQMQQVFLNIIINAEYFMIEAHNRGTLTITTEMVGTVVRASFADDGPGIPPENLGRLFDPFFTTKEAGNGTGLGLSICHGILAEHGGRIYAVSEPGQGATLVVELPLTQTAT